MSMVDFTGIPPDQPWVLELRQAVADNNDLEGHTVKRLAKALQTLQWADMCPQELLQRAEDSAITKVCCSKGSLVAAYGCVC